MIRDSPKPTTHPMIPGVIMHPGSPRYIATEYTGAQTEGGNAKTHTPQKTDANGTGTKFMRTKACLMLRITA